MNYPIFNKWIRCVEFPQENYKGFKTIKLPYSQAHENKARRDFYEAKSRIPISIERDILDKGLDINNYGEITKKGN